MSTETDPAPAIEALKERVALLERALAERQSTASPPLPLNRHHDLIYQELDGDGRLSQVSHAWLRLLGYGEEEVLGRSLADFLPEEQDQHFRQFFPRMKSVGEVLGEVFVMRRKDGGERVVSLYGWIERDSEGNFLSSHCILQDVTRVRRLEKKREWERQLLGICHQAPDLRTLMESLTLFFQTLTGCEAVGIRLRHDGDYPYYQAVGFPAAFIKAENSLCSRDERGSIIIDYTGNPALDCMCGNVIRGRFDASLPFFTARGSFWTNSTTQLLASTSPEERQSNTRNRCNGVGYESVALIPIKDRKTTYGLFQFNDRRPNRFTTDRIEQYEQLISYVSLTLAKHLADHDLRISEKKHRTVVENAQEAIAIVQWEKVVLANRAAAQLTGRSVEQLEAGSFLDLVHHDDRDSMATLQDLQLKGSTVPQSMTFRIVRSDGETRWVERHGTLIEWNGRPASLHFLTDITAKRQAELARQEHEQNLQAILNAAPESIQLFDLEGRTLLANEATARRLKTTLEELRGKIIYDFFPADIAASRKTLIERVIASGEPQLCRDVRNGIVFDAHIWPVFDHEGRVCRLAVFAVDSSERELAAKRLEESHQLLRNLANMVPGVVYQYRLYPDGRSAFPYASPGMYAIYEVTPEEVREDATPVFGRLHPEDHDRVSADIFRSARTLSTFLCEFRVILPTQGLRWRWSQAQPQAMEDGSILWHGIISDVTDRKLAEEKLRESNAYLENLINYANVPIIVWDMQFRVTRFNHAFEELTGRRAGDVLGQSISLLFPPAEIEESMKRIRQTVEGVRWKNIGINIQHASGEIRSVLWNSALILGADGKTPAAVIAQGHDVSEQRKAEEEKNRLSLQLQQAHKMEAIGTLAGDIAHDFNNILGGIIGYAEMVHDDCPPHLPMAQDVAQILKAANRAKELVKQILAFSRQARMDRIPVQPAPIFKEAVKLLRASLPSTISIVQDIEADCGMVLADPTQLHQILVNLATNALHAMEASGGTLTVTLRRLAAADPDGQPPADQDAPGWLQLTVADTGCGIAEEVMSRIFDPYFTTKEVGKGTGMGLAMVHGIVKSYNGSIRCESKVGEGTTFRVTLPATRDTERENTEENGTLPRGNERILLVDDERILVEMGRTMLVRLGYRVTALESSLEALATFQERPDDFDLVITDQTMPGMTGIDLARRLLQLRPGLPIILCTGFSNIISEETAAHYGIRGYCLKPLTRVELSRKIRSLLDR